MPFWPTPRRGREAGGSTGATGFTSDQGKRWMLPRHSAAQAIRNLLQLRGHTSLSDTKTNTQPAASVAAGQPGEIRERQIAIDGQSLRVAIRHGRGEQPPLLLFNGIGANWEWAKPLLAVLTRTTAIIFDVPGVGGSPGPLFPSRPSTLARLAAGLVAELGFSEIDVAGVSWGGGS